MQRVSSPPQQPSASPPTSHQQAKASSRALLRITEQSSGEMLLEELISHEGDTALAFTKDTVMISTPSGIRKEKLARIGVMRLVEGRLLEVEVAGGIPILLETSSFPPGGLESFFSSVTALKPQTRHSHSALPFQNVGGVAAAAAGRELVARWLKQGVDNAGGQGVVLAEVVGSTQGLAFTKDGELIVASDSGVVSRQVGEMSSAGHQKDSGLRVGDVHIEADGYSDSVQLLNLLQLVNSRMPSQGTGLTMHGRGKSREGAHVGGDGAGGKGEHVDGGSRTQDARYLDVGKVTALQEKLSAALALSGDTAQRLTVGQSFALALTEIKVTYLRQSLRPLNKTLFSPLFLHRLSSWVTA